jgi:hypothetical protein
METASVQERGEVSTKFIYIARDNQGQVMRAFTDFKAMKAWIIMALYRVPFTIEAWPDGGPEGPRVVNLERALAARKPRQLWRHGRQQ